MEWKDINHEYNGVKVSVSAKSTPQNPTRGEGPFVGTVLCPKADAIPLLLSGQIVRHFAWYWDVEIIPMDLSWKAGDNHAR